MSHGASGARREVPDNPSVHMVDVFGTGSFDGNPLAVVTCAVEPSAAEMQQITRWFNLSESTFLLPPTHPDADYRVRIFTLDREFPFAGHPTLGTARVWLDTPAGRQALADGRTQIVQECGVGLVPVRLRAAFATGPATGFATGATAADVLGADAPPTDILSFAAPDLLRSGTPTSSELAEACELLGLEPSRVLDAAWVDNGPGWLGIRLASAEEVLALNPGPTWHPDAAIGVVGAHAPSAPRASSAALDADMEVRAFCPDGRGGLIEDPVTGSLNASLGQWLFATGVVDQSYVAAQGTVLGRRGRVHVSRSDDGRVWVGGRTSIHVAGQLRVPFAR